MISGGSIFRNDRLCQDFGSGARNENRCLKVYLAGPIFQCEDRDCIDWRQFVKRRVNGFEILDPMERDYRGDTAVNCARIVEEDKTTIDTADDHSHWSLRDERP